MYKSIISVDDLSFENDASTNKFLLKCGLDYEWTANELIIQGSYANILIFLKNEVYQSKSRYFIKDAIRSI